MSAPIPERWIVADLRRRKLLDFAGTVHGEDRAAALNELAGDIEQELISLRGRILELRHCPPPPQVIGERRGVDPSGEDRTC